MLRNIVYDDEKFNVRVDKDADAKVEKYADATTSGDDSDPKTPIFKTQVKIKPGARTPSKPTPTKGGKRKRYESSPEPESSEAVTSSDEDIIVTPKKS